MKIILPKQADLPKDKHPKCVIKVKAGRKYYIGRSLNFDFILKELQLLYNRYKYRQGVWDDNLYLPIIQHVVERNLPEVEIEILFQSESGYQVLKEELRQLETHFGKRDCLNRNDTPYVPKFKTPSSPNKWLTHNEFLNFKKLLANAS